MRLSGSAGSTALLSALAMLAVLVVVWWFESSSLPDRCRNLGAELGAESKVVNNRCYVRGWGAAF